MFSNRKEEDNCIYEHVNQSLVNAPKKNEVEKSMRINNKEVCGNKENKETMKKCSPKYEN